MHHALNQHGWYGRPAERCGLRSLESEVSGRGSHALLLLCHAAARDPDMLAGDTSYSSRRAETLGVKVSIRLASVTQGAPVIASTGVQR